MDIEELRLRIADGEDALGSLEIAIRTLGAADDDAWVDVLMTVKDAADELRRELGVLKNEEAEASAKEEDAMNNEYYGCVL